MNKEQGISKKDRKLTNEQKNKEHGIKKFEVE